MLADLCPPDAVRAAEASGRVPGPLWRAISDGGFRLVGLPEAAGGGGTVIDAAGMVRLVGRHVAPVPLSEAVMLGGWMLSASGLPLPEGMLTVGPPHDGDTLGLGADGTLTGELHRVPWAQEAEWLAAIVDGPEGPVVICAPLTAATIIDGRNLAGEPRCTVRFDGVSLDEGDVAPAGPGVSREAVRERGALSRALMMAGALERTLELTVEHAATREQFGRPLNRFQAVAQNLAVLAETVMQARMASDVGTMALDAGDGALDAAVAKVVTGAAASEGARIAHQIHGAIGITSEYEVQLLTRRLWAWRDEYGNERVWGTRLGDAVLAAGASAAWDLCATTPGAMALRPARSAT